MNRILPLPLAAARALVLASCLSLVAIFTYTRMLVTTNPNYMIWLVQIVPLMMMLPGVLRRNIRTYQWLCFMILLYFINAVLAAFTPGSQSKGLGEIIFCVVLFSSAIFFINGYRRFTANSA